MSGKFVAPQTLLLLFLLVRAKGQGCPYLSIVDHWKLYIPRDYKLEIPFSADPQLWCADLQKALLNSHCKNQGCDTESCRKTHNATKELLKCLGFMNQSPCNSTEQLNTQRLFIDVIGSLGQEVKCCLSQTRNPGTDPSNTATDSGVTPTTPQIPVKQGESTSTANTTSPGQGVTLGTNHSSTATDRPVTDVNTFISSTPTASATSPDMIGDIANLFNTPPKQAVVTILLLMNGVLLTLVVVLYCKWRRLHRQTATPPCQDKGFGEEISLHSIDSTSSSNHHQDPTSSSKHHQDPTSSFNHHPEQQPLMDDHPKAASFV